MTDLSEERVFLSCEEEEAARTTTYLQPAKLSLPADYSNIVSNVCQQSIQPIIDPPAVGNMENMHQELQSSNSGEPRWNDVVIPSRKRNSTDTVLGRTPKRSSRDPRLSFGVSFANRNRFEVLADTAPQQPQKSVNRPQSETLHAVDSDIENTKRHKPPPIYLKTEVNFQELRKFLNAAIDPSTYTFASTRNGVTIYPSTPDTYRAIVRLFAEKNTEFHTYQLPEDKAYRVVIRGLHSSISEAEIAAELTAMGFPVRRVTNVLSRTKEKLPLFFVDMQLDPRNGKIFDVKSIFQSRITIEAPRQNRQIVQCTRCQRYGHTKGYCNLSPRCVKCAGEHHTNSCTKPRDTPATCVLCNESHPANYRGCEIHRQLQNRRPSHSALKSHQPQLNIEENSFPPLPTNQRSIPRAQPTNPHRTPTLTYAHALAATTQDGQQSISTDHSLVNQMSTFIMEMKQIITPMISLMSQLMQLLMTRNAN